MCPVTIRINPSKLTIPVELPPQGAPSFISIADIHRLAVKNYLLLSHGRHHKISNVVGWALVVEAGGRAYTLTFGLDEVTAEGLLEDICRAVPSVFS